MKTSLTRSPIPCAEDADPAHGASVVFRGVVRELEDGMPISGIDYSCYPALAERQLQELAREAGHQFGEHGGNIVHRVGFVAAGEAAVAIEVETGRSGRAFEICRWYLRRIKEDVPIWKEPVFIKQPAART